MIVISLPDENARIWGIPPYLVQILLTSYHFHVDQTGEAGKKKSQPRASHILQNNLVSASGLESRT